MKSPNLFLPLLLMIIIASASCKKQPVPTDAEPVTEVADSSVLSLLYGDEAGAESMVERDAGGTESKYVYPIHRTNVDIPYGHDDEKSYYGILSGQDIMHFIYQNDSVQTEPGDSSYIWDYYIDTGDLLARTGEDHVIMKDIILVFVRYLTGDQKPPYFGDREEYNELVIIRVENRNPSVITRMDFGPSLGQISEGGPYGVYEGYTAGLIGISPQASGIHVRYSISDRVGDMEESEANEEIYIYSLSDGYLKSVLAVDTEETESDYEGSNSMGWWVDLAFLESTREGMFELEYVKRTWEREDDEMLMEEIDTVLYYWNGEEYIQDNL